MSKTYHRCGQEAALIVSQIAEREGMTLTLMQKPAGPGTEPRKVAHVRQEAMHALYATGKYSQAAIGLFLGRRDMTTVWHGIKSHAKRAGLYETINTNAWFNLKPVSRDLQSELIAYWRLVA